jgi:polar amino acid transport system substrate-binding protein
MRILVLFCALVSQNLLAADCVIRASISGVLPPYYFYDKNHRASGYSVDMLRLLFEPTECELEFIELPWGRALELLFDGEIDVMTNLTATESRKPYLYFIGPHNEERIVMVVDSEQVSNISGFEQLKRAGVFISALANGYYGPQFQQAMDQDAEFNHNLILLRTSETQRQMLKSGRIAAVVEDERVYQQWLQDESLNPQRFVIAFTLYSSPVHIGVSRKSLSPGQIALLRAQWQRMCNNGQLKALAESYNVPLPPSASSD